MFMGEYNHTIDTKGRMIIPAKIREQLGDLCIVTKGLDNCLAIYTAEAWKKISTALQSQSSTKASVRALKRFVFGSAAELEYDKQGRVLIPVPLREYASLDKQAVIVGAGDHVEIWSREKFDFYDEQVAESMEELVEGLEGIML
ncbi:division/cell wall cluster transcriptional repressor MraZ [Veillonella parvula]|uniref:division/cell wall cluster transcriptional repressor MraZ n=1 Tax=Veillonella parvula TaxID=29466 RepID=UPI00189C4039|nr:division/cell wall cluster transcriptional repressor MraZ [Veillonella parvula]MBS6140200.1 division/cell wall cluster transcriptional repressor MraZ [Veillonella parvula]MDU7795343.1 division/cell wall cluster transcriptional repressor MraZ [Veillonella parvula]